MYRVGWLGGEEKTSRPRAAHEEKGGLSVGRERMASDPCVSTEACVEKVVTRLSSYRSSSWERVETAAAQVAHLKAELLQDESAGPELSVTGVMMWEQALKKLKDALRQLSAEHKDIHGAISKTGKEIDKNFTSDFTGVVRGNLGLESDEAQQARVNRLVAQHFLTQGHQDLAELLAKESGLSLADSRKEAFAEVNQVTAALERRQLGPALLWVSKHRQELRDSHSRLELTLHRLRFIQLLQEGPAATAAILDYMPHFEPFLSEPGMEKEVCEVLGAVVFLRQGLEESPYAGLLGADEWAAAGASFRGEASWVLGLPVESPLSAILNAGTVALPALLNLRSVMEARHVVMDEMWRSEELPMDIDLGPAGRFHSVFACPILRQQTTTANPPMRLECGHAISRDALHKLATNTRTRVKCPYCPAESAVSEAKRIYF